MLFSVVIPLYNKADTIERTIRSVWGQTYNDYELIVVNDGSTDGSLEVVKQLSKEADFVIIDKENGGVSSARNAGAKAASGRYIALLDGDDIWYPNHLEMLADAISKHPDVKFFGTGYEQVFGKYVHYTIPWGGCWVKDVYSAFRYGQPIHTSTVAVQRFLWNEVGGFNEGYSFYEDYEFFFRLGRHTKCCVVRIITGKYMGDALEQATKRTREISQADWPHIVLLESWLNDGCRDKSITRYACIQAKVKACLSCINRDLTGLQLWDRYFPCTTNLFLLWPMYVRGRWPIFCKVYAFLYMIWYRARNHMIIWVRFR